MSARRPSRRTRNMRRTCLTIHYTPGAAFTEPFGPCVAARTSL